MPSAPNEEAVGRAWSWAWTKAGSTRERGLVAGGVPAEISVMTPLSCRSTTFSSRPRSGPENRLCAGISVIMTCPLRHCERSEAIHPAAKRKNGLLRRFAPLRKRFAFVAGNDGLIHRQLIRRIDQLPLRAR